MKILIIGSGAREHAIARALLGSETSVSIFCCGTNYNPGILALSEKFWCGNICNIDKVICQAKSWQVELAIIGPEAPLEQGMADQLENAGIPTVGPKKKLAQIETSKQFGRRLLQKYHIPGSLNFQVFKNMDGAASYLQQLGDNHYVVKADGLMSGKGVKVAGEHLHSIDEALAFCQSLVDHQIPFLIEEKLIGQEFSLMCFTDGESMAPMPLVQDHKRAYVSDKGPNTGGMGSYSDNNHILPFLTPKDIQSAHRINELVLEALRKECNTPYQGILYGSFIATKNGVQLIEYNARFGDPEAMNVLSILDCDFLNLCQAMVSKKLSYERVSFKPKATVCKYIVPNGYPDKPLKNTPIDVSNVKSLDHLYFASVNQQDNLLLATGSRAIAVVGAGDNLTTAESCAEEEVQRIKGEVFHRADIGTMALIQQRIQMMRQLRQKQVAL